MTATTLLLIDVQNDFHPGGSLAIPTANDDADRIASLIRTLRPDRVVATLDSHHALHIAHPEFWVHGTTHQHPEPFTVISSKQVADGTWKPRDDLHIPSTAVDPTIFDGAVFVPDGSGGDANKTKLDLAKYCVEYCSRLEANGRFQLCIWPPHCLIGTEGHALVPAVQRALLEWSRSTGRSVEFVLKGQALLTEMYSAVCADVPVSAATSLNRALVDSLMDTTRLVVAGQAMSHCVNYTVRDIVRVATSDLTSNEEDRAATARKIYVLTDCASAVPGFEGAAQQFLKEMRDAGVSLVTSSELLQL
jgi:nicotinamidase/pyrazinamidase